MRCHHRSDHIDGFDFLSQAAVLGWCGRASAKSKSGKNFSKSDEGTTILERDLHTDRPITLKQQPQPPHKPPTWPTFLCGTTVSSHTEKRVLVLAAQTPEIPSLKCTPSQYLRRPAYPICEEAHSSRLNNQEQYQAHDPDPIPSSIISVLLPGAKKECAPNPPWPCSLLSSLLIAQPERGEERSHPCQILLRRYATDWSRRAVRFQIAVQEVVFCAWLAWVFVCSRWFSGSTRDYFFVYDHWGNGWVSMIAKSDDDFSFSKGVHSM